MIARKGIAISWTIIVPTTPRLLYVDGRRADIDRRRADVNRWRANVDRQRADVDRRRATVTRTTAAPRATIAAISPSAKAAGVDTTDGIIGTIGVEV